MKDLNCFKELHFQILVLFGFDVFAIQPNFIAGSKTLRLDAFIVNLLLEFWGIVEVLTVNNH